MIDYIDFFKSFLIPLVVPFVSVWFAYLLTKKYNKEIEIKNQKNQRVKILNLLKKEAELFKEYKESKNEYRSKEFVTIKRVINGYEFNIEEHGELIFLALELERINQNIEIAVNNLTLFSSGVNAGYINNLVAGNLLLYLSNLKLIKWIKGETHAEKVQDTLNKQIKKSLEDSTKEATLIIEKLNKEIDRLLIKEANQKK